MLAQILLACLVLGSEAEARILTGVPECPGFYAKVARFLSGPPKAPDELPFDIAALEKAIEPGLMLEGHGGMVNAGLWHYAENGRRYFVKSLGAKGWANEAEITNAKAMASMGIGPKVHAFKDEAGTDYLLFDHVPGVNGKGIGPNFDVLEAPDEVEDEIRRALALPAGTPWAEVEKTYFAELYARRFEAVERLKEIRKTLFAHDYYRLQDFQFMIHFEKGKPGVEIQVIDSAYFTRGKPRDENDALTMPLDKWIRSFERWKPGRSAVDPQLENMIEPNPRPAAHH